MIVGIFFGFGFGFSSRPHPRFKLLFLLFVIQVFDFVIALHCSGRIQIIRFSSIATAINVGMHHTSATSFRSFILYYLNRTVWYIIMP